MSVKQTDKLEQEFRDYSELTPSENKIIELESNVLVILIVFYCFMYTQKKDNVSVLLSLKKLPVKIEMIDSPNPFENPLYLCVEKKILGKNSRNV